MKLGNPNLFLNYKNKKREREREFGFSKKMFINCQQQQQNICKLKNILKYKFKGEKYDQFCK